MERERKREKEKERKREKEKERNTKKKKERQIEREGTFREICRKNGIMKKRKINIQRRKSS